MYNERVELTETTDLLEEWFVDSISVINTVLFMETEFGININPSHVNRTNFKSIATLCDFVQERLDA